MKKISIITLILVVISTSMYGGIVDSSFELAGEHPGKTTAIVLCTLSVFAAIVFAPALTICLGTGAGGFAYDELTDDNDEKVEEEQM